MDSDYESKFYMRVNCKDGVRGLAEGGGCYLPGGGCS